jgi:hypothetical protein
MAEASDTSLEGTDDAPIVETPAAAAPAPSPPPASKLPTGTQPVAKSAATTPTPAPKAAADTPADWPTDWREKLSGGDSKLLARVSRYQSPKALADALIAAQNKISSGELKPGLSDKPTADEIKTWREAHGIPETFDKYDLKGVVEDPEDKPLVQEFLKAAHESHQTPEQVRASLTAYYAMNERVTAERAERDVQAMNEGEEGLRAEWGDDYRRHLNVIHGFLDGRFTKEVKDKILTGRLSDGTPIGSSPEVLKGLLATALELNPSGTVVPGATDQPKAIEDEIAKIEATMGSKSYLKNEAIQQRLRDLYDAREAMKSRQRVA